MAYPSPVIIRSTAQHTATVIFLHGLGDTGHGWSQAFEMIKSPHVKYICPTAKTMRVTLNAGMAMPAWFDIKSLAMNTAEDHVEIKASSAYVQSLIEEEIKNGIEPNRIVVGGFSQGGAIGLYSALTSSKTLAGILALSTWLPLNGSFPGALKGNSSTPILQCHGKIDPVVNFTYGEMTAAVLSKMCSKHTFMKYSDLGHSSSPKEMEDVKNWLNNVIPTR
ncbi:acyl-protein thioesterase 1 [Exaiptasia diaphana]|uniref:palmitoyl-protein hydrolase n=1 Tax=Exaiptasia diaphana TaxID=2652724 RepID=A0A913YA54_EXADI|nr:acyl-protein thioesterase 1 [Exaiptasia diaphana]KXJ21515.1 Acyl-protein thioesterase 1 [Exaiptasia diaphana]